MGSAELRIGIDAFPMAGRPAGIGRYVFEICRELDHEMPNSRFYLYSPMPISAELPSSRWSLRVSGARLARYLSSYTWLKVHVRRLCLTDRVDVFWATRTLVPALSASFKTVSTVHDLNGLLYPQSMPFATMWAHRLCFHRDVRGADAVVANSFGTSERLLSMMGVKATGVARPGVAPVFRPLDSGLVVEKLERMGIAVPYFLAVGTLEPRKNLVSLIEAFDALKRTGRAEGFALLIAGSRGWRDGKISSVLSSKDEGDVRWLGFVPDEELAVLYSGATALILPSLYEGFGIPALEARACGAPVVATDIPEIREAGGAGGIYVTPTREGLCEGLLRAIEMRGNRSESRDLHSWQTAARTMATLFTELAKAKEI